VAPEPVHEAISVDARSPAPTGRRRRHYGATGSTVPLAPAGSATHR
jgi:hypothetical protein